MHSIITGNAIIVSLKTFFILWVILMVNV